MKNTFFTYSVETKHFDKGNEIIRDGILDFNAKHIGEKPKTFSVFVRNPKNEIIGGAIVYAHNQTIPFISSKS